MSAVVVGATFLGSVAAAFVVQKAVLGAMLRTLDRGRTPRNEYDNGQESALGGIR